MTLAALRWDVLQDRGFRAHDEAPRQTAGPRVRRGRAPPGRDRYRREPETMTVGAILKHKGYQVTTVDPTARIAEVVDILAQRRIGAVLVVDETEQLLGIVSERDLIRSLSANGMQTLEMTAGQLMTRAVQAAQSETTEEEAMRIMTAGRFRHLPVVDHNVLIGLISLGDVVKARLLRRDESSAAGRT